MTDQEKEDIYQEYSGKVKSYILGKIGERYLTEDLCSDVFLKVFQKLDTFDGSKSSFSTWIYTITRNTLIDYFRTRRVNEEIPEELTSGESVLDSICNKESLEELANALSKLGSKERDVIIFYYYHGMNLKTIAEKMNISYSYTKLLHSKALAELKLKLAFI